MCCKYGAPKLAPRGSIVLFSGWICRKPVAGVSTLAAVDTAIEALGRTLALEIALRRGNTVVPGMIDTPLWAARLSPEEQRAHFDRIGASLPFGHTCRSLMENGFGLLTDDLRSIEAAKISCGKAHFKAISDGEDGVRYIKARTVDNIFEDVD